MCDYNSVYLSVPGRSYLVHKDGELNQSCNFMRPDQLTLHPIFPNLFYFFSCSLLWALCAYYASAAALTVHQTASDERLGEDTYSTYSMYSFLAVGVAHCQNSEPTGTGKWESLLYCNLTLCCNFYIVLVLWSQYIVLSLWWIKIPYNVKHMQINKFVLNIRFSSCGIYNRT